MKIHYLLTWADAIGGTERVVLRQASWLAAEHDVEVVSVFRDEGRPAFDIDPRVRLRYLVDRAQGVHRPVAADVPAELSAALAGMPSRLVRSEWESAFSARTDLEAERLLATTDADIVVSTTPALLALAAQLLPPRALLVHQEHRVAELRGSSGGPHQRYSARADAIVLLTERTRDWFASQLGPAAPHLEVIPNALDRGYRPGSGRDGKLVVWAGRLTSEKQPVHAVRVFAEATRDRPDWRLRLFGDGPQKAAVMREAAALGVQMRVELMGTSRAMIEEWARASVALVTSRNEAFPLVLPEAMAAGVPCVSYDCPNGPAEIISHGENGFLAPPGDVDALAAMLRQLVEDDELRDRMGETAAASTAPFELDSVMKRWERLFNDLVAERRTSDVVARRLIRQAEFRARGRVERASGKPSRASGTKTADTASATQRWAGALEARHPGLAWTSDQLTVVSDRHSAADVADGNLRLVVEALEGAQVDYVLVRRQSTTHRVAIRAADRERALAALRASGRDRPIYVEPTTGNGRPDGVWPADQIESVPAMAAALSYKVFEPVVTSARTLRFGAVYGCVLEVWTDAEEGDEFVTPSRTPLGYAVPKAAMVPATTVIGGREYRTIEPFVDRLATEITFPIDVVYTWVDGDDPAWRARRDRAAGYSTADSSGTTRFRSRDELRYSLRSLDLFASWVHRIWIVTDGQTPSWLDTTHPRVRVVDHREIFSDPSALPTFNSHAIESQLHHIEGLAEQFLYFNDDVFLGRLVSPTLFFNAGGLSRFFQSPTRVPPTPLAENDELNIAAAKNNRELLRKAYGKTFHHAFLHAPHPLRRSTLRAIEIEFAEAHARTMHSRFRAPTDISVPSSLAHYHGLVTGHAVAGEIRCAFVNVGIDEHRVRLNRLLAGRGYDVFCLNDFHDGDVPADEQAALMEAFLAAYFPVPSQYERGTPRNTTLHATGRPYLG